MIKLLLLFFPLFLFAHTFSVATYNVYNLFDDEFSGSEYKEFAAPNWNTQKYKQKLARTAKVLQALDADIIALQEIENENVLLALKKVLKVYPYHAVSQKKGATVTGLLSKYPVREFASLDVRENIRDILKATLEIKGYLINIYVNHWASLKHKEYKRILSAKVLMQDIAAAAVKEYILLGDFNANYNRYLFEKEPVAINEYLHTTDRGLLVYKKSIKQGQHYNLWLETAIDDRFSYLYRERKNTLDHIIVPQTLFDQKGIDYLNNSFKVFKPSYLFAKGKIKREYSDHLPLLAKFSTTPFTPADKTYKKAAVANLFTKLQSPLHIESATVTYTDRYGFIIKDASKRSIFVYAPGVDLQTGTTYDFLIHSTKLYNGYYEVDAFELLKKAKQKIKQLHLSPQATVSSPMQLHEVFKKVQGRYAKGEFFYNDTKIDLYFQDKGKKPKKEGDIILHNVRVSKYKGRLQLVVSHKSKVEVL